MWELMQHRSNGKQDVVRVTISASGLLSISAAAVAKFNQNSYDYYEFYVDAEEKAIGIKFVKDKTAFTRKVNWLKNKHYITIMIKIVTICKYAKINLPEHTTIFDPFESNDGVVCLYKEKQRQKPPPTKISSNGVCRG